MHWHCYFAVCMNTVCCMYTYVYSLTNPQFVYANLLNLSNFNYTTLVNSYSQFNQNVSLHQLILYY